MPTPTWVTKHGAANIHHVRFTRAQNGFSLHRFCNQPRGNRRKSYFFFDAGCKFYLIAWCYRNIRLYQTARGDIHKVESMNLGFIQEFDHIFDL